MQFYCCEWSAFVHHFCPPPKIMKDKLSMSCNCCTGCSEALHFHRFPELCHLFLVYVIPTTAATQKCFLFVQSMQKLLVQKPSPSKTSFPWSDPQDNWQQKTWRWPVTREGHCSQRPPTLTARDTACLCSPNSVHHQRHLRGHGKNRLTSVIKHRREGNTGHCFHEQCSQKAPEPTIWTAWESWQNVITMRSFFLLLSPKHALSGLTLPMYMPARWVPAPGHQLFWGGAEPAYCKISRLGNAKQAQQLRGISLSSRSATNPCIFFFLLLFIRAWWSV